MYNLLVREFMSKIEQVMVLRQDMLNMYNSISQLQKISMYGLSFGLGRGVFDISSSVM